MKAWGDASASVLQLVAETTSSMTSLLEATSQGWKRALRILGAAIDPRADDKLAEKLLQHAELGPVCVAALQASPVNAALKSLLEVG